MDEAERALIERARGGDGRAFEQLVRPHDRRILALALDMVGHPADAQDVCQEALVAAFRGLSRFRQESEFATWLYGIAVRQALKLRGRRRRREEVWERAGLEGSSAAADSPEDQVLDRELESQLDAALGGLSGQERAAFVLCHRQGLRVDEAAEIMQCSSGSVKSYLFRGRDKVKRALGPYLER
ncbi:MAG: sigma-70 family RNA polymerase sigma factor [Gemmatimonadota bacterium]